MLKKKANVQTHWDDEDAAFNQSTAAPAHINTLEKAVSKSLLAGLEMPYPISPGRLRICKETLPDLVYAQPLNHFIPRSPGESIVRSESSAPAIPSSQTEK